MGFPPILTPSEHSRASSRRRSSVPTKVVVKDFNTKADMIMENQLALIRKQQLRHGNLSHLDFETELRLKEIVERLSRPTVSSLLRKNKQLHERNDIGIICQYEWSSHGMKQYEDTTKAMYNKQGALTKQTIKGKYHYNR